MQSHHVVTVFALAVVLITGSCSAKGPASKNDSSTVKDTAVTSASTNHEKTAPEKTILFFMNPNGGPCRMQSSMLDKIKDTLAGLATVTYIKTTESGDRELFEKYGIRGLPSLIIVDKTGKELTRFSAGIQSEKTILSALHKKAAP
jgi:thioredoxin 1